MSKQRNAAAEALATAIRAYRKAGQELDRVGMDVELGDARLSALYLVETHYEEAEQALWAALEVYEAQLPPLQQERDS